jgi:hypothetical protein
MSINSQRDIDDSRAIDAGFLKKLLRFYFAYLHSNYLLILQFQI